ncbi:hypothetical protein LINPERHAP2_LOCUS9258 [Linum perenne]
MATSPREISPPVSSYRGSSQSDHDIAEKVDGEEVSSLAGQAYYDPTCDHSNLVFKEGMRFTGPTQFKDAVVNFTIAVGAEIKWVRSNRKNKEAACLKEGCKWRVYASWYGRNEAYIVKAVGLPHNCPRPDRNRSATAKWILSKYFNRFRIDPDLKTKHLVREISETHGIAVSMRVCSNAKQLAKRMLEGTLAESYSKLRSYVKQLQTSDPRGHFILEVDPVHVEEYVLFKRIFVGFSCLRRGFRVACRRMFGLDGCFLKGEVKWMLLSAVGKDGNNQMFPIAWAVVEGENRSSWTWFIE